MSNKIPKQQPNMRMRAVERAEAARAAQAAAERRRRLIGWGIGGAVLVVAVAVAATLVMRGGDEPSAAPSATALDLGCSSCHTVDGARSEGPTWKGLYGSTVNLDDGTSVVADEDYLRRSITDPAAQVPMGYQPTMPTVDVTDAQLDELIAEMRALAS